MRQLLTAALLLLAISALATAARGDGAKPAVLGFTEVAPGQFDVVFKVPRAGNRVPVLRPVLPEACPTISDPVTEVTPGEQITRWRIAAAPWEVAGQPIRIEGLAAAINDTLVRFRFLDGSIVTRIVMPELPYTEFPSRAGRTGASAAGSEMRPAAIRETVRTGLEHAFFGLSHVVFAAGLALCGRLYPVLAALTAFAFAHLAGIFLVADALLNAPEEGESGRDGAGHLRGRHMVEHDGHVGQLLDLLDELKITDNTIAVYTTDNGPHSNEWPDGGISPFRGEKNTNWEGGYRVPAFVRRPGKVKAGSVTNEIVSHQDWVPTLMAAVGDVDVKEKLKKGMDAGDKSFKVHLDGYNQLPLITGKSKKGARKEFFYFSDDGQLVALRYNAWKLVFAEQRARGFMVWSNPFTPLRVPKVFNLRRDPFERADTDANNYERWWIERVFLLMPSQVVVKEFVETMVEFPPRQKPAKFNVDDVLKQMQKPKSD